MQYKERNLAFFEHAVRQLSEEPLDGLALSLLPLMELTTDPPALSRRQFWARSGLKTAAAIASALGMLSYSAGRTLYENFKHQLVLPTVYDAKAVFGEVKTPPSVNPPVAPATEPFQTPVEVIGKRHIVEFLLGNLTEQLIVKRLERYKRDPALRERVSLESLQSPTISALLLVTDETRDKPAEFVGGGGRSDVVMFIHFDPKTLRTIALSFPRDLFVPELRYLNIEDGGAKINNLTVAPAVDQSLDPYDLGRIVMESATGVPIDTVIQVNIDFIKGFVEDNGSFQPGAFDRLFPNGLEIEVPSTLSDSSFPSPNYGRERFTLEKGTQVVNGNTIARFTRTRVDSDYARDDRQRQIVSKATQNILIRVLEDLAKGETITLDTLANSWEEQTKAVNLFFDLNIIAIAKTIRDKLKTLRSTAEGLAALSVLTINSRRIMGRTMEDNFISLGLTRENRMVENVTELERYYRPYMVMLKGSDTLAEPTELGNFLKYWESIRQLTRQLLGQ